ncbi:MAG: 5-oxoprolinase subunit PxpB [Gammaproteobacteria bacterium]|nr:5-oxoprolinase subunit PxpB [Gammaproteobacteria bacterium]
MEKFRSGQSHIRPAWRWISERGLLVMTGDETLARYEALLTLNRPEVEDIIPADGSLFVVFRRGETISADLRAALAGSVERMSVVTGALHEIAVEYGGAAGPDLPALAEQACMDEATYVNSHAAVEYVVAFLGFQPGFPYLRGLPRALHAPRRASPRLRVAAGSVAIGGAFTGIYSASGPGGWQIIGHAAAVMFDPQRDVPALLMAGDRVRFVPR